MPQRILLLLVFLLGTLPAVAQTVYKITGADGRVRFSDTPPAAGQPGVAVEEVVLPPLEQNVLQRDPAMTEWADQQRRVQAEAALEARKTWQQEYDEAVAALAAAEKALAEGSVLQEEDLVGIAGGGARPSEEFSERTEALEQAAQDARDRVDELLDRQPAGGGALPPDEI